MRPVSAQEPIKRTPSPANGRGGGGEEGGGEGGGGEEEGETKASHSGLCPFPHIFPFQDLPFFSGAQISALLETTPSVFFALKILQFYPYHD